MKAISRSHYAGQFGPKLTTEQMIEIFSEHVLGFQIDVAEEMVRQFNETLNTSDHRNPMRHCGFAVVSCIFSYFEMIAQYIQGSSSLHKSKSFFGVGFRAVYPTGLNKLEIDNIYDYIRCGLYYDGTTRPMTNLYEKHQPTFSFDSGGQLLLNPVTLVQDIKTHFSDYIKQLKDVTNVPLRQNFATIFSQGVSGVNTTLTQMYFGSGSGYS